VLVQNSRLEVKANLTLRPVEYWITYSSGGRLKTEVMIYKGDSREQIPPVRG